MTRRLPAVAPPGLVGLILGACYLTTLAPAVLGHDHGEYVTTGNEGGVPHPPGYPLYVLWLRAWSWLPLGAVLRTSLASAALGLGAVAVLFAAARRWGASPLAAAIGAALYGLSPRLWLLHTHADNLSLASLQGAAVLWVVAAPLRPLVRAGLLGLLAGTAVCSHHTLFTLAPVMLWGLVRAAWAAAGEVPGAPAIEPEPPVSEEVARGWWATQAPTLSAPVIGLTRRARRGAGELRRWVGRRGRVVLGGWARVALTALVGMGAGLLPFAYSMWLSHLDDGRWVWGRLLTLTDLLNHIARHEYGFWNLTAARSYVVPDLPERLQGLARRLGHDLLWLPALLGVLTGLRVLVRVVHRWREPDAWGLVALTATFGLAGPTLSLINDAPLPVMEGHFVGRLDVVAELTLCLLVALGVEEMTSWLSRRGHSARGGLVVALLAVLSLGAARSWAWVRETHRPTVQLYLTNLLGSLPPGAVLVGGGDEPLFGLLYLQRIEHLRLDVVHVSVGMAARPWYRARVSRLLGLPELVFDEPRAAASPMLASLLATGRPVLAFGPDDARGDVITRPEGVLLRVLPAGSPAMAAAALEAQQQQLFARFTLEPRAPRPGSFGARIYRDYARSWRLVAERYRAEGRPDDAARVNAHAATFAPP